MIIKALREISGSTHVEAICGKQSLICLQTTMIITT